MYVNEKMYELGSKKSAIRELFEYGKKKAKEVGAENVYDFSLGNPTVPAPDCVNETIRELTNELDSISLHGYTSAQGDEATRKAIADYLNKTYDTHFNPDNFYMTCGAAASLTITLNALVSSPQDEVIAIAPFFPEYRVFATAAGAKFVVVSADTTTNFAPAAVANTLYSGKNGAIAITSSCGLDTSAFSVIVNEAAAPHVI